MGRRYRQTLIPVPFLDMTTIEKPKPAATEASGYVYDGYAYDLTEEAKKRLDWLCEETSLRDITNTPLQRIIFAPALLRFIGEYEPGLVPGTLKSFALMIFEWLTSLESLTYDVERGHEREATTEFPLPLYGCVSRCQITLRRAADEQVPCDAFGFVYPIEAVVDFAEGVSS